MPATAVRSRGRTSNATRKNTRLGQPGQWAGLHINGGGAATREDAERQCLDAIAFALEGDPSEYDSDAQAVAPEVSVAPAA